MVPEDCISADYTIRTNYTCVPSASQKVNKHSHGVPRGYKRYFTSGFLVSNPQTLIINEDIFPPVC